MTHTGADWSMGDDDDGDDADDMELGEKGRNEQMFAMFYD